MNREILELILRTKVLKQSHIYILEIKRNVDKLDLIFYGRKFISFRLVKLHKKKIGKNMVYSFIFYKHVEVFLQKLITFSFKIYVCNYFNLKQNNYFLSTYVKLLIFYI